MPTEAEQLLKEGKYKYLDVRTPEEFAAGHVPAAVNVPVSEYSPFVSAVEKVFPSKQAPLVVGCKSGRRSQLACAHLTQAGYTDLVNLTGGFDLWAGQGLPV